MKLAKENHQDIQNLIQGYLKRTGIALDEETILTIILRPVVEISVETVPKELLRKKFHNLWDKQRGLIPDQIHTRVSNFGNYANIATIFNLVTMTESQFLNYRNMGKVCLRYLKEWLESMGLSLGMEFGEDIKHECSGRDEDKPKKFLKDLIQESGIVDCSILD